MKCELLNLIACSSLGSAFLNPSVRVSKYPCVSPQDSHRRVVPQVKCASMGSQNPTSDDNCGCLIDKTAFADVGINNIIDYDHSYPKSVQPNEATSACNRCLPDLPHSREGRITNLIKLIMKNHKIKDLDRVVRLAQLIFDYRPNPRNVPNYKTNKRHLYLLEKIIYDGKILDRYTGTLYEPGKEYRNPTLSVEHLVPGSVANLKATKSDLHNLIPVELEVNLARKSFPFAKDKSDKSEVVGNDRMVIRDEIKGFIARSVLYIITMYYEDLVDLESFGIDKIGDIKTFVRWCEMYPPDENEKLRNNLIEEIQMSRNPFIDNPELCKLVLALQ
eukprot:NODE_215_length_14308_cov_0.330987.p4 type:complete len:332 gc:universal NODE_215_length_14308_cov_0.330987:4085-5080(+)